MKRGNITRMSGTISHTNWLQHYPPQWSARSLTIKPIQYSFLTACFQAVYWFMGTKPWWCHTTWQHSNKPIAKQSVTYCWKSCKEAHWSERTLTSLSLKCNELKLMAQKLKVCSPHYLKIVFELPVKLLHVSFSRISNLHKW